MNACRGSSLVWTQTSGLAHRGRSTAVVFSERGVNSLRCHPGFPSKLIQPNSLRTFSKETSASDLHSQVSQTLRTQPPPRQPAPPSSLDPNAPRGVAQQIFRDPDRRARYNQALWNTGAAFMLMLMAAQSLKSGRERRRVASELAAVEAESAERLALLQLLFQDATIDRLVDDIIQMQKETPKSQSSFLFRKSDALPLGVEKQRLELANVLLKNLDELVGSKALDEAQRETLRIRLAKSVATPAEPAADGASEAAEPSKRVPFTM